MVVHCLQVGWMELHIRYEILVLLTRGDFTQGLAWVFFNPLLTRQRDRCVIILMFSHESLHLDSREHSWRHRV